MTLDTNDNNKLSNTKMQKVILKKTNKQRNKNKKTITKEQQQ